MDGEVVYFGDEISLVDDRGMIWNNKDGRHHGRLGPSLFGENLVYIFEKETCREEVLLITHTGMLPIPTFLYYFFSKLKGRQIFI